MVTVATWVMAWATTEDMVMVAMEVMPRMVMEMMPRMATEDMVMVTVATWVMAWATTEDMVMVAMEVMPRMVMEMMPRMATEDMAWVATEDMVWVATVDMEVMAWVALEKAFGLLTASPATVLDLMANLKAMASRLLPIASNLNLLILPRTVKHNSRSNLPNISHPNSSLSLPSNPPTSNLVTLEHLPMDMVSSLPTIKELNLPGSASSHVP